LLFNVINYSSTHVSIVLKFIFIEKSLCDIINLERGDSMKNKSLLILLCIISLCGCILCLYAGLTVEGSGFLDLSNFIQMLCFSGAVLFGCSAAASFYFMSKK